MHKTVIKQTNCHYFDENWNFWLKFEQSARNGRHGLNGCCLWIAWSLHSNYTNHARKHQDDKVVLASSSASTAVFLENFRFSFRVNFLIECKQAPPMKHLTHRACNCQMICELWLKITKTNRVESSPLHSNIKAQSSHWKQNPTSCHRFEQFH